MLRKQSTPLLPELRSAFDLEVERNIAQQLPLIGPLGGLFVLMFWAWDGWIDPSNAGTALGIRVSMVAAGALAYRQGHLRWTPSCRCAWVYTTHAGAVALCAALPERGLVLALPGLTGAMFMLALVEPRPHGFLLALAVPSALLIGLALVRLPAPLSVNTILLYLLSLPLALGAGLANLDLRRQAFLAEHKLLHAVRHDSLTGALSRAYLTELATHDILLARRHQRPLTIAMLDIDWFKRINDRYGHACGDDALRALVKVCRSCLRASDYIGRIGGEEFVCVMPETDAADGVVCAERMRHALAALSLPTSSGPLQFTVSIGLAVLAGGEQNWESLLRAADTAMYEAKAAGRNRTMLAET